MSRPRILISNDDGLDYEGLQVLIEIVRPLADLTVVVPLNHQSGASSSITINRPISTALVTDTPQLKIYTVDGTPTDCVKLALDRLLAGKRPDYMLSGINHGYNAGIYSNYSGTIGAAREAVVFGVPAMALSHQSLRRELHLGEQSRRLIARLIEWSIGNPPPAGVCLNVNIPADSEEPIRGIRHTTSCIGYWDNEYEHRVNPFGMNYYWLMGDFRPNDPDDDRTDIYWLRRHWATVTPLLIDPTAHIPLDLSGVQV